jgi:CheY-like chemotaxis protein
MANEFLLVDDDSDDSELFCEALHEVDNSVHCHFALDGQDALNKLPSLAPDVIFLDINMPGMNGWDCLNKLKSDPDCKHIPVIMYSTSSHKTEVEKAFDMGAHSFFSKPSDYKQLKKVLRELIDKINDGTLDALKHIHIS